MHILSVKKIYLCSLLNHWNYSWNEFCNLLFLAICRSQFPLLVFPASSWFQKAKITLRMSLRNKKIINYHSTPLSANFTKWSNTLKRVFDHFVKMALKGLKAFTKQPVIKQSPSRISVFFSFFIKVFVNFERKIDKISSASFHCT